jgi:hypothetical protein
VAGGSFTPVNRSITALASLTGILLTVSAAISCTEGEAPPVSLRPNAGSAGKLHCWQRRHQPRSRLTVTGPKRV